METKLYYSVHNGGDGSAYPRLYESMELAELDQKYMYEGWGESCTGCFVVESETPITIKSTVTTAQEIIDDLIDELKYSTKDWQIRHIHEHIAEIKKSAGIYNDDYNIQE